MLRILRNQFLDLLLDSIGGSRRAILLEARVADAKAAAAGIRRISGVDSVARNAPVPEDLIAGEVLPSAK